MNIVAPLWASVDSKSALSGAIADQAVAGELMTEDPNEWGFFSLPGGKVLVVGYADLGLVPVAALVQGRLLIGIDEVLAGFDPVTHEKRFSYRMPSVFHEFVSLADPIIIRDEIGFVAISSDGEEQWCSLTSGPIKRFAIESGRIVGETIDDESFAIPIPS